MTKKILMKGNEALCEGAIAAGCMAYFGYPITPQNEVPAYMSRKMVELGRVFIQAESELAAINMVFGAAVTGTRTMTSSSSPGISLKQEGISYLAGAELPSVIVNVQRGGPGLGNIAGSQGDYYQATRGGGHGDYRTIVLAPHSVQEMHDLTFSAFDLADKYRIPVLILSDGVIGQMIEPLTITNNELQITNNKDWVLDGCKDREPRLIRSLFMVEGELEKLNLKLAKKYEQIKNMETKYELYDTDDAEIVFVAFGISARICKSVIRLGREQGLKLGLIRPITLWPFPEKIIAELSEKVKKFVVIEMNLGQMVDDVKLAVNGKVSVKYYGRSGGSLASAEEILEFVNRES